jgi:hypothetical protein
MKSELAGGARHQSSLVSPRYFCLRRLSPARIKASEFGTGNFSKICEGYCASEAKQFLPLIPAPPPIAAKARWTGCVPKQTNNKQIKFIAVRFNF